MFICVKCQKSRDSCFLQNSKRAKFCAVYFNESGNAYVNEISESFSLLWENFGATSNEERYACMKWMEEDRQIEKSVFKIFKI